MQKSITSSHSRFTAPRPAFTLQPSHSYPLRLQSSSAQYVSSMRIAINVKLKFNCACRRKANQAGAQMAHPQPARSSKLKVLRLD